MINDCKGGEQWSMVINDTGLMFWEFLEVREGKGDMIFLFFFFQWIEILCGEGFKWDEFIKVK